MKEKYARRFLQQLYVALTSSKENAHILASGRMDGVPEPEFAGHPLARKCMRAVLHWLSAVRDFSISDEVFRSQILEPIKAVAELRYGLDSTFSISGLVISKSSDFFDRNYQARVNDIAMAVPVLRGVYTLRVLSETASQIDVGSTLDVDGIQPMPYINRIHPVKLKLKRATDSIKLSDLQFLNISEEDFSRAKFSVSFENFCHIACTQRSERQMLGAAVLLRGRIVRQHDELIVQHNEKELRSVMKNVVYESDLRDNSEALVLISLWYDHDLSSEALMVEEFDSRYAETQAGCQSEGERFAIKEDDRYESAIHPIIQTVQRIRTVRTNIQTSASSKKFICWKDILDAEKLKTEGVLRLLLRNPNFCKELIWLICRNEERAVIGSLDKFPNPELAVKLKYYGLIIKSRTKLGKIYTPTKHALDCMSKIMEREVFEAADRFIANNGYINLSSDPKRAGIPATIFRYAVNELSQNFEPLVFGGVFFKNILILANNSRSKDLATTYVKRIQERILNALLVDYPVGKERLLSGFSEEDRLTAWYALRCLETTGVITHEGEPPSWFYPYEKRLLRILRQNEDRLFSTEELLAMTNLPRSAWPDAPTLLSNLLKKGEIVCDRGKWASRTDSQDALRKRNIQTIIEDVMEEISRETAHGGSYVPDYLIRLIRMKVIKRKKEFPILNDPRTIEEIISEVAKRFKA